MATKEALVVGRVVFARVGRMHFYAGPVPGDERPIGGGKYNLTNVGSEVLNFKKRGTRLYGYFETSSATLETNLRRVDPGAVKASALEDVLVVFVAPHPERGQVIVGWYGSAKLLRQAKPRPDSDHLYRAVARVQDSVLLPDAKRLHRIPSGTGAMGQSNVCYPFEQDGSRKRAAWMKRAIDYVRSYDGENLLVDEVADAEHAIAAEAEKTLSRSQGRWVPNAKERRALELYGVARAMAHFSKAGFHVENVGDRASYDVCCTKARRVVCVEVKATTTSGEQVILTPREAALKGERALFVVHSVGFVRGKPKGGVDRVVWPWKVEASRLKPISYMYRVPETNGSR